MLRQNCLPLRSPDFREACLCFPSQRCLDGGVNKDSLKSSCGLSKLFLSSSDSPCNDRGRRDAKLIEPRLFDSQRLPIVFFGYVGVSCRQRDFGGAVKAICKVSIIANLARQPQRLLGGGDR